MPAVALVAGGVDGARGRHGGRRRHARRLGSGARGAPHLPLVHDREHRRGDEDRGVRPGRDPDEHREREVLQRVPPNSSNDRIGSSTTSEVFTERMTVWFSDRSTTPV